MEYYTLDRKTVADMLNISTRTLDRYVAKKTFSTKRIKGKVFFHAKEIEDFLQEQNTESIDISRHSQAKRLRQVQDGFSEHVSQNNYQNSMSNSASKEVSKHIVPQEQLELQMERDMYKKLYEKTQELHVSQLEKLQQASYRVGELEQKLQSSVPLLAAQNQKQEVEAQLHTKEQKIQRLQTEQSQLQYEAKTANFFKVFYFATTLLSIVGASFFFALT